MPFAVLAAVRGHKWIELHFGCMKKNSSSRDASNSYTLCLSSTRTKHTGAEKAILNIFNPTPSSHTLTNWTSNKVKPLP